MKKKYENIILIVISISLIIFLGVVVIIRVNKENNENNTLNESISNEENYHVVSSVLKNNSKEKIEKIVVDQEISSEDMENIFYERALENQEFENYTIWFFSSENKALESNTYELGCTSNKDGNIVTKNVKEEEQQKAYEEQIKKQEEEDKKKEEEAKKSAKQKEKEFKNSCKTYTYESLARNPEKMKGTKVKLTGEVAQVSEGMYSNGLRVDITKDEYGWYEDTIYVTYVPEEGEDKILEDDIITIWGTSKGEYSYTSIVGASITIPYVSAEYIEIN